MDKIVFHERLSEALDKFSSAGAELRHLAASDLCEEDKISFDSAGELAQIISGVAFIGLAMWLIFANTSKMAVAQKAPLEARHNVCATISTAIALFSGFFNLLQLTKLDDFELPGRETKFALDLSRPIEWIVTCPIMQLKLVILAGARIPSYRRFMMPLLSVSVLLCGTASMFTADALRFVWLGFGLILATVMFTHNVIQIGENSDGEESAFRGESDFRKLSLLLIITWVPFPVWFSLSVEGFGVITDILTIQMGWVVLNIVSKFSFIILMQRIKTMHSRKLDATRDLYGITDGSSMPEEIPDKFSKANGIDFKALGLGQGEGEEAQNEIKLAELVNESMVTLGLTSHTERFLKLLVDSGVTSTEVLERLTADRSMELNLPWSLVDAVQKRWRAEKMAMGQDGNQGNASEDPFKKLLEANKEKYRKGASFSLQALPGAMFAADPFLFPGQGDVRTPPLAGQTNGRLEAMEQKMDMMMNSLNTFQVWMQQNAQLEQERLVRQFEGMQDALCQRMDFSQVTLLQTANTSQVLLHKLDSSQETVIQAVNKQKQAIEKIQAEMEDLSSMISGSNDGNQQALLDTVTTSSGALLQKITSTQQELLQQTADSHQVLQQVASGQAVLSKNLDASSQGTQRRLVEIEGGMDRKIQAVSENLISNKTDLEKMARSLHQDMSTLATQGNATVEVTEKASAEYQERMVDIRRQNMMIMDMLTSAQESIQSSSDNISSITRHEALRQPESSSAHIEVQLREVVVQVVSNLQHMLIGSAGHDGEMNHNGENVLGGMLRTMIQRLEEGANRLESAAQLPGTMNALGGSSGSVSLSDHNFEEVLRRELASVALALTQQHRDQSEQMSESVLSELHQLKDSQQATAMEITEKVSESVQRLENGINKVLNGGAGDERKGDDRKKGERTEKRSTADRG